MKKQILFIATLMLAFVVFTSESCDDFAIKKQAISDSGVEKATVEITTDFTGMTVEQQNIIERIKRDTQIGSIKHLYIISSYTGDVLIYSTIKGKVTSSGKGINPGTVVGYSSYYGTDKNPVRIGGQKYTTNEMMDEYGTYGNSSNYVYWFTAQDNYQQYFPSGGTFLFVSDVPMTVRKSNLTVELK